MGMIIVFYQLTQKKEQKTIFTRYAHELYANHEFLTKILPGILGISTQNFSRFIIGNYKLKGQYDIS